MATRDFSDSQEKRIAKLLNGKVTPNSGGTRFGGGDILTKDFLIEAKTPTTYQASFSIKKEWINKAAEQAFEQGKTYSSLAFRFNPDGNDYFVITERLFKQLVEMLEGDE